MNKFKVSDLEERIIKEMQSTIFCIEQGDCLEDRYGYEECLLILQIALCAIQAKPAITVGCSDSLAYRNVMQIFPDGAALFTDPLVKFRGKLS